MSTTTSATTPQPTQRAPPPPIAPATAPVAPAAAFTNYYSEQNKFSTAQEKYPTPASQSYTPQPDTKKRTWGRVFNTAHTEGALHNGMRPTANSDVYGADSSFAPDAADEEDDGYDDIERMQMSYRRADGVEIVRQLPGYA